VLLLDYDGRFTATKWCQCDRVFPCRACCLRGTPSECEYTVGDAGRLYVTQAEAIEALQLELASLQRRLANLENVKGDTSNHTGELASEPRGAPASQQSTTPQLPTPLPALRQKCFVLRAVYDTIADAPSEVVYRTIAQIRDRLPVEAVAASIHASSPTTPDPSLKRPIKREASDRGAHIIFLRLHLSLLRTN
jgi:hypothetical protein